MTNAEPSVDSNFEPTSKKSNQSDRDATKATSRALIQQLLVAPTPSCLRQLHTQLLAAQGPDRPSEATERALIVACELHGFLVEMESTLDARHYSHLASLMDIGSVSAAALESLVDPAEASFAQIALAALSAGLMVAGTRQHVTAWSRELEVPLARGVWFLREELWRLSVVGQQRMSNDERERSVEHLLAPMLDTRATREDRLALLGRTFQIVLLVYLARALCVSPDSSSPDPAASG